PALTPGGMTVDSYRVAMWYHSAIMPSPGRTAWKSWPMPTARVGAPPARESIALSPMSAAVAVSTSGVTLRPQLLTTWAALAGSVPITAAGLFMAKYTPGSMVAAATIAMIATNDSISMPP